MLQIQQTRYSSNNEKEEQVIAAKIKLTERQILQELYQDRKKPAATKMIHDKNKAPEMEVELQNLQGQGYLPILAGIV